jgi:hypothetical protein
MVLIFFYASGGPYQRWRSGLERARMFEFPYHEPTTGSHFTIIVTRLGCWRDPMDSLMV